MNSLQPLPLMADVLPLPALDLTGRVPPSNTVVNLDGSVVSPELTLCKMMKIETHTDIIQS